VSRKKFLELFSKEITPFSHSHISQAAFGPLIALNAFFLQTTPLQTTPPLSNHPVPSSLPRLSSHSPSSSHKPTTETSRNPFFKMFSKEWKKIMGILLLGIMIIALGTFIYYHQEKILKFYNKFKITLKCFKLCWKVADKCNDIAKDISCLMSENNLHSPPRFGIKDWLNDRISIV
jgi:hypothetical protein